MKTKVYIVKRVFAGECCVNDSGDTIVTRDPSFIVINVDGETLPGYEQKFSLYHQGPRSWTVIHNMSGLTCAYGDSRSKTIAEFERLYRNRKILRDLNESDYDREKEILREHGIKTVGEYLIPDGYMPEDYDAQT